jgi:uncharacterized protein DUF3710
VALDTTAAAEALPLTGPHDGADLDPEVTEAIGVVDFGSIRVPIPPEGKVTVEPTANGRMQAVHIALSEGRLSVSALAAPKSSKLWPELAREIDASLREGGARVRSFQGDWGRELHAASGGATSVFVGVDGSRWMLYGVATGPTAQSAALDSELRRMLRGTVVVRGKAPYPVRTILPLVVPEYLAQEVAAAGTGAKKTKAKKAGTAAKAGTPKAGTTPKKTAARRTATDAAATNSSVTDTAARKAALRKAAAKAAAKAAVRKAAARKAAAEAADAGRAADTEAAATRAAVWEATRSGTHPAPPSTISTGPGPDAPLREQAPSARRAAAAAWRQRPAPRQEETPLDREGAAPERADRGHGVRPRETPPAAALDVPAETPTHALPQVEPGTGGRRRLREPGPAGELPPGGRRRLREPAGGTSDTGSSFAPEPEAGGRRRLRTGPGAAGSRLHETGPLAAIEADPVRRAPAPGPGGRRYLREPDAEPAVERPERGRRRYLPEADVVGSAEAPGTGGRRRLREPDAVGAAEPAEPGGRRRLRDPDALEDRPASTGPEGRVGGGRRRPDPDPIDEFRSAGRRALREPGGGPAEVPRSGRRHGPDPDPTGEFEARGRRALRESGGAGSAEVSRTGGRRYLREPDTAGIGEVSETGRRRLGDREAVSGSGGRRALREQSAEFPASNDRSPLDGPDALEVAEPARPFGRERDVDGFGAAPRSSRQRRTDPDPVDGSGSGGRRYLPEADPLESAELPPPNGRRHVREPAEVDPLDPLRTGTHRLEPYAPAYPGGRSGGRRRPAEPAPVDELASGSRGPELTPTATGEEFGAVDRAGHGTGGRRRLRAPDGPPDPTNGRDLTAHGSGAGGRRRLREPAEGPAATGSTQRAGRHASAQTEGDPSLTVPLRTLIGDLDPHRPRGRHRRYGE